MKLLRKILFIVGISYLLHLFVVRLPYITTHVTGYMAKITPYCFWWGTISLFALIAYALVRGADESKKGKGDAENGCYVAVF